MNSCITRCYTLLLIGLGAMLVYLPANIARAESDIPVPTMKPSFDKKSLQKSDAAADVSYLIRRKPVINEKLRSIRGKDETIYSNSLSKKQASLYKEIFALQAKGKINHADKKIKKLNNNLLMGHVLAQRYLHPTAYRSKSQELGDWLSKYKDFPQAKAIYKLAQTKGVSNISAPQNLKSIRGNLGMSSIRTRSYKSTKSRTPQQQEAVLKLFKEIKHHIKQYEPTNAQSLLGSSQASQYLDSVEYDQLRAIIASGYLYAGKLQQASTMSSKALNRSGGQAPYAGWVQGLVQWQYKNYAASARAFESAATSTYSSGWMISACAYWASRAHMRAGNISLVSKWLDLSASYPKTFYGLIATRALGNNLSFDWSMPKLSRKHVVEIETTKRGQRAGGLIQAGQKGLAENELQYINSKGDVKKQEALLAYANHYKLPALLMKLGNAYKNPNGGVYEAALYPLTSSQPQTGFKIDEALMLAIIRQESRFQQNAHNPTGATGLMQLMPTTANYISGKTIYDKAEGRYKLNDPSVNLEIGQKYVQHLLAHPAVKNDLLSMTIAYNAGPGTLSRWKRERKHIKDPLLFIETIPYNETRAFIERVLSNYWIYRMRLNQDTPSLDAVAEGRWARYASQSNLSSDDLALK